MFSDPLRHRFNGSPNNYVQPRFVRDPGRPYDAFCTPSMVMDIPGLETRCKCVSDTFVLSKPAIYHRSWSNFILNIKWKWLRNLIGKILKPIFDLHNKKMNELRLLLSKKMLDYLRSTETLMPYFHKEDYVDYHRIDIDFTKLEQCICESQRAIEMIFNHKCDTVVVGRNALRQYQEYLYSLNLRFPPGYGSHIVVSNNRLELAGLRVVVVPWFEGVLPLPKEAN